MEKTFWKDLFLNLSCSRLTLQNPRAAFLKSLEIYQHVTTSKCFLGMPTRSYTCPGFIFVDSSLLCLFPRVSQPYIFPLVFGYEERQSPFPSRLPILGFSVLSHGESIFCCVEAHGPNTKQRWTSNTNGREFCSWTARLEGKPWAKGCETFENLRIFALVEQFWIFE